MPETATLPPPSSATPPAQVSPDSTVKVQEQVTPQSLTDKANAALAELRSKKGKPEAVKTATGPEDAPGEPTPGEVEGQEQNQEGDETPKGESEAQPVLNEALETISVNGKEVPLVEALDKMTFEVYSDGELHPMDFSKLLDMASFGVHSAEKTRLAKDAVVKAQDIIREVEQSAEKSVSERVEAVLNDLLTKALNGTNGNGKPFVNDVAQKRAVELARGMKDSLPGNQAQKPLTMEDVEELVQKRTQKILEDQNQKQTEAATINQLVQESRAALVEISKGDPAYFTKGDGKLNTAVLTAFRKEVAAVSNAEWHRQGSPKDSTVINDIIAK